MRIPYLEKKNDKTVLMVQEKPFIAIAGEVHNSDSSSPEYMEQIWKIADELGMNTLLLPVSWEMIEPEEGSFDFTVVKALIDQARSFNKKILFLWFGSWKNAECMYAPEWVKTDLTRFQRAQIKKGKNKAGRKVSESLPYETPYTTISYLCENAMQADAKAFAELMKYIKAYDEAESTVIAVQVENETGLLGAAREVSDEADALFEGPVPQDFADYMNAHTAEMTEDIREAVETGADSGTWTEVFRSAAEEIFSAYYISKYVNFVAEAGKEVYPLPMAVNCWLDKGGRPGSYPTGGPVSKVHEVWNYNAPAIEIYGPDIYVPNFMEICDEYTRRGNALFIPEAATHSYAAARLVYTVGHYHAMCYSPFGFDDIGKPFSATQGYLFGMDVTDEALKTPQNYEEYGKTAHYLQQLMPILGEAYGTSRLQAACGELKQQISQMMFGEFGIAAVFENPMQPRANGYCLVVQTAENECYILADACSVSFLSGSQEKPNIDLLLFEEGEFEEGIWKRGRRLNGDEAAFISFDAPTLLHAKFFVYD